MCCSSSRKKETATGIIPKLIVAIKEFLSYNVTTEQLNAEPMYMSQSILTAPVSSVWESILPLSILKIYSNCVR